ncbi:PLDc N-terminal domain-containing protein [Halobacillus litoralis]|uniref:PLDc N-terminal domain-containing protein n=1 Tax=Halobacillus litoralis TaxID=45668 RepID=UPI001CFCD411|nr:PLDc N-terminal domain-containing protein [Halobacillus litoralis]
MELGFFIILFFIFGIGLLVLNIITSVWAYRDAVRKGRSTAYSLVVLIATLFFPLVGLIVYLIIRND